MLEDLAMNNDILKELELNVPVHARAIIWCQVAPEAQSLMCSTC